MSIKDNELYQIARNTLGMTSREATVLCAWDLQNTSLRYSGDDRPYPTTKDLKCSFIQDLYFNYNKFKKLAIKYGFIPKNNTEDEINTAMGQLHTKVLTLGKLNKLKNNKP